MANQKKAGRSGRKINLIASDEKQPGVTLKPGMRLDVVSVTLLDSKLKRAAAKGSRLCGGTSTCVALVELGEEKQ